MTNGNGGIPGFFVAGGIGVSNTAILIGGLAIATALWLSTAGSARKQFSDRNSMDIVEGDVFAYAADVNQIHANRDRIRAAIERARAAFKIARDAYRKKRKDLFEALRNGTITKDQYKVQRRAASAEFHAAIRTRWQEIHTALGVATRNPHSDTVVPTVP